MTQSDIASLLKVSQATYSPYESGAPDVPSTSLVKLADFYKVSVDYILGRMDRKETNR